MGPIIYQGTTRMILIKQLELQISACILREPLGNTIPMYAHWVHTF